MNELEYKRRKQSQAMFEAMLRALPDPEEDPNKDEMRGALRGSLTVAVQAARFIGLTKEEALGIFAEEFDHWDTYVAIRDAQKGVKS